MKYKAVFFDFDYTLGDATDAIYAGFTAGMTALGQPIPDREAVRYTVGQPLEVAYTNLTGDADPEHQARFRAAFSAVARPMQQTEGVPLFPGAADLLHALHEEGIHVAVVSTKQRGTLEHILDKHGLMEILDFVIGGDYVSHMKPDPESALLGMERLGLSPEELLFCGDTVIDAETAKNAGCDFAAVLNGTTPAEDFDAFPSVCIAPDLFALREFLKV